MKPRDGVYLSSRIEGRKRGNKHKEKKKKKKYIRGSTMVAFLSGYSRKEVDHRRRSYMKEVNKSEVIFFNCK